MEHPALWCSDFPPAKDAISASIDAGDHFNHTNRLFKQQSTKVQIRGAQIPSNDSYWTYVEAARNEAQQRIWAFYEAVLFYDI